MNSKIFSGKIFHQRNEPIRYAFTYPACTLALDLDELAEIQRAVRCFGWNRFNLLSFYETDYLPKGEGSLKERATAMLRSRGFSKSFSRVELITNPRFLGYVFNPVSFYLFWSSDQNLVAALAEVNNTFGENHLYVLDEVSHGETPKYKIYDWCKEFHVSPFNDMKGTYRFYFSKDPEVLDVRVNILRKGRAVFVTRLLGSPSPVNTLNIVRSLGSIASSVVLTSPRIMWQAFRLKFERGLSVYTKPIASSSMTLRKRGPSGFQKVCMNLGKRFLSQLETGHLAVQFPDGLRWDFGEQSNTLRGTMLVKNYDFFSRSIFGGDIGFGESFVKGHWDADDLTKVLRVFVENVDQMNDRHIRLSKFARALSRIGHVLRANTTWKSKDNISAHYDLSNELFSLFLDSSMTYSCARFENPSDTLEQAQKNKIISIIKKAQISADDHVLEIGCGWGSFAIEAVKQTGCRVTGITLSSQQRDFAIERIKAAGLEDRIDVRLVDYRKLEGKFDKIVSIEMLEAVGHEFLGRFFSVCDRLLNPNGLLVIQVISMTDQRYDEYRKSCDWIQKHIFPGGVCPSLTAIVAAMTKQSKFVTDHVENIGVHYARTLREWRERFLEKESELEALGFDENFQRAWHYYLSYCEAGFASRALGTLQLVLSRPHNNQLPKCPGYNG